MIYITYTQQKCSYGFLKFLKGTDIFIDKEKYNYKYNKFPPFEVLQNDFLPYKDLAYLKDFETTFELVYNSKMFKETINYLDNKYDDPFKLYETITNYFISTKLIERKISYEEIYLSLIEIFKNNDNIDLNILIQTLTYDYTFNFKGTRDFMYHNDKYDYKQEILNYIKENMISNKIKNSNEKNNNNYLEINDILKNYRFLILDYNINNKKGEKTIYKFKK